MCNKIIKGTRCVGNFVITFYFKPNTQIRCSQTYFIQILAEFCQRTHKENRHQKHNNRKTGYTEQKDRNNRQPYRTHKLFMPPGIVRINRNKVPVCRRSTVKRHKK